MARIIRIVKRVALCKDASALVCFIMSVVINLGSRSQLGELGFSVLEAAIPEVQSITKLRQKSPPMCKKNGLNGLILCLNSDQSCLLGQ